MDKAKITMLGTSGAGKTCYMLGLYATMQLGLQGFTLSTPDLDEDLRLTNLWDRLVEEEGEERWPPATGMEPHRYDFDFSYGMRKLISFDWLDYRGGAIQDSSSQGDVQTLMNRLKESTCIFLCVSGELLSEESNGNLNSVARKAGITRMNQFVSTLSKELSDDKRPFPIVLLVTKYDQCYQRERESLIADIKQLFKSLFVTDQNWLVMLCPVSLGKELSENPVSGEINPKNLHLPLIFALYAKLRESIQEKQGELEQCRINLSNLRNRKGLVRLFNSQPEDRASQTQERIQRELDQFQKKFALLGQELAKHETQIFMGEKEVEIDV